MEKTIVIYKTKYGSAEKYARWIAEELHCDLARLDDLEKSDLKDYDLIIYGGGVHAGGIRGWDTMQKWLKPYLDIPYYESAIAMDEKAEAEARSRGEKPKGMFSGMISGIARFRGKDRELGKADFARGIDRTNTDEFWENYHPGKTVLVFAVGINVQNFDARAQLREVNFDKKWLRPLTCYYLDGEYVPEKVTGIDAKIIGMMKKMIEGKGLNATGDERELLRRVNEGVSLVDREKIGPIVSEARKLMEE